MVCSYLGNWDAIQCLALLLFSSVHMTLLVLVTKMEFEGQHRNLRHLRTSCSVSPPSQCPQIKFHT